MHDDWRSQTVVVTGSSGSGKSTVCRLFSELGALILSADVFAKQALSSGSPLLGEVRREFGSEIFSGAELDRQALGRLIFANPEARKRLEEIVHPEVRRLAECSFAAQVREDTPLVIYDCPLFFEAKLGREHYRAVILVTAPEETRIERIISRDRISREDVLLRLQNQLPDSEKIADETVHNNGDMETLKIRVRELFEKYRRHPQRASSSMISIRERSTF